MAGATLDIKGDDGLSDEIKAAIAKWAEAVSATVALLYGNKEYGEEDTNALLEIALQSAAAVHAPCIHACAETPSEALNAVSGLMATFAERVAQQAEIFSDSQQTKQ